MNLYFVCSAHVRTSLDLCYIFPFSVFVVSLQCLVTWSVTFAHYCMFYVLHLLMHGYLMCVCSLSKCTWLESVHVSGQTPPCHDQRSNCSLFPVIKTLSEN